MLQKKFWKGVATISIELLFAMSVFTTGLVALVLSLRPLMRQHKGIDLSVFEWLARFTTEGLNKFMVFTTFFATHPFLIPANILLILYFLFISKKSWHSIRIAAIALSSLVFTFTLKFIFMRSRPDDPLLFEAAGYSFPSGHAIMGVTFYGLMIYIVNGSLENKFLRWLFTIFFIVLILLIGFSRIYLRVHYASDVLAGFLVGIVWLLISLFILRRIEEFNKFVPPPKKEEAVT